MGNEYSQKELEALDVEHQVREGKKQGSDGNKGPVIEYDSIGRAWIICPSCGRKTPAWQSSNRLGVAKKGFCRWCEERWET